MFKHTAPLLAALTLACAPAFAATMSKGEYSAEKDRVKATQKAEEKSCDSMTGNAKDICNQEAKGKEKVALAELEYRYTGKADDGTKLAKARADATFEIAKEKCDDQNGAAKDQCRASAKVEHEKARKMP